jgi:hypothetical protein
MSAIWQTASGFARWSVEPLAFRQPRGFFGTLTALGPVATARVRTRQFLQTLRDTHKRRPGGSGDPGERPETLALRSYWDDPALWMLMMH